MLSWALLSPTLSGTQPIISCEGAGTLGGGGGLAVASQRAGQPSKLGVQVYLRGPGSAPRALSALPPCPLSPPHSHPAAVVGAIGNVFKQNRINPMPQGRTDLTDEERAQSECRAGEHKHKRTPEALPLAHPPTHPPCAVAQAAKTSCAAASSPSWPRLWAAFACTRCRTRSPRRWAASCRCGSTRARCARVQWRWCGGVVGRLGGGGVRKRLQRRAECSPPPPPHTRRPCCWPSAAAQPTGCSPRSSADLFACAPRSCRPPVSVLIASPLCFPPSR